MAIQLDWIPYGGSNSLSQDVSRVDVGIIANVNPVESIYMDTEVNPNTLYQYEIYNNCLVGGPVSSNLAEGVDWFCPPISVTEEGSSITVTVDSLEFGYIYSIHLYDSTGTILIQDADPFPPTNGEHVIYTFFDLDPSTTYTIRVVIIPQDTEGQPVMTGLSFDCDEVYTTATPVSCDDVLTGTFTASALDTANSGGPSRGAIQIGYNSTPTGASAKSSGSATISLGGSPAGGTLCDTPYINVTSYAPVGFAGYRTIINVYLNSALLGQVFSPESTAGGSTIQVFNYTRSLNDAIHIEYDSELV